MSDFLAPASAGITSLLTLEGRLPAAEVHAWFRTPRRELVGLAPATLIELVGQPGAQRALELARQDVARMTFDDSEA